MTTRQAERQIAKALKLARRMLAQPYGWTKRVYKEPEPRSPDGYTRCAKGALYAGYRAAGLSEGAYPKVIRLLQQGVVEVSKGTEVLKIAAFNDAKGTHKKDVLKAFDVAIRLAEGESDKDAHG